MTRTQQQQVYTHAAQPKAISHQRPKYREDDSNQYPANIMFDRRVVRGNTYAAQILAAEPHIVESKTMRTANRSGVRKAVPRTPEPVEGRRHLDIQTDAYLEELVDTVPEAEISTQTDPFIDRPPTPLFIPQKSGVDATTQIEQGDLFDFEYEVEPILEVLVGKVLEQGLMEVMEEEELAAMRAHQEHMEQIRNAELVATQRMEAAEKRKLDEKERRMAQERDRVDRENVVREKVAASTFSRGYLNGLIGSVFDKLERDGFFFDPIEREVETEFMPLLRESTLQMLRNDLTMRQVVGEMVQEATKRLEQSKADAQAKKAQQQAASEKYAEKEAASMAALQERIETEIAERASFILNNLSDPVATPEAINEIREELKSKAEETANAALGEAKAKAEEEAKAKYREGKEEADINEADEAAAVEAALSDIPPPEPKEVTDQDVLSAMLDKEITTKEKITHALAVEQLGEKSYTNALPKKETDQ
ncbi:hypothetical protein BSKO_14031 [Bryopsis sp. KO-2023]|nr:hypothetical protein BSKO_14031 [Bryopsis sp. KO-2023]